MKRSQLLFLLLLPLSLQASEWQFFPFADQYRRVQCAGDDVFMLKGNRLLQANGRQWVFERDLNRQNGLSENDICDLSYSPKTHKLAIVYENGMIDILHEDGSFSSISELREAPFEGISKRINHVAEGEGMLCISTDFGFLTVDMEQELIQDCFTVGQPVTYTWIADSHYFYRTQSGETYTCGINSNLFNPNNWSLSTEQPPVPTIPDGAIDQTFSITGDTIYTLYPDLGLTSSVHSNALSIEEMQQGRQNNRLAFCHGTLSACLVSNLVYNDYVSSLKTQGYLSEYDPSADQWFNMTEESVLSQLSSRKTFGGIMDMIPDPAIPHRYYYSTMENGIYVIQDGQLELRWDNFDGVSNIEAFADPSARVGGMTFSPQGDFWFVNEGLSNTLRVRTADGTWHKFSVEGTDTNVGIQHLIHSQHSQSPTLWGCKIMGYEKGLVFAYDYAGTIEDRSDDRCVTIKTMTDQNGNSILPKYFNNVIEGPDGSIWILTTQGIYVIDTPEQAFEHPGQVRTVFDGMVANTLLFDTEHRIWIATQNEGLYLYDPSATKQLQHFNTDNCLLTSNEVVGLAFDAESNTLWVSCNGAILSYQYDEFEYSAGTASAAYCYPSLVKARSTDPINVVGLRDHADVSIRNEEGQDILTLTAIGGTVSISPTNLASGTYSIVGTDQQGQYGLIDSFTIE